MIKYVLLIWKLNILFILMPILAFINSVPLAKLPHLTALVMAAEDLKMKILQYLKLCLENFSSLDIIIVSVKYITLFIFLSFMRYLIKKGLKSILLNHLEEKFGLINKFIFNTIYFVFLFVIVQLFSSINNVVYADTVVYFNANDVDVTVRGTFVDNLYSNFSATHTFCKSAAIAGSIMRLVENPKIGLTVNPSNEFIEQGVWVNPENTTTATQKFEVAFRIDRQPIDNIIAARSWDSNTRKYVLSDKILEWDIKLNKITESTALPNAQPILNFITDTEFLEKNSVALIGRDFIPIEELFEQNYWPNATLKHRWDNFSNQAHEQWLTNLLIN